MFRKIPDFPPIDIPENCHGKPAAIYEAFGRKEKLVKVVFACAGLISDAGGAYPFKVYNAVRSTRDINQQYLDQVKGVAEATIAAWCEACPLWRGGAGPDPARAPLETGQEAEVRPFPRAVPDN